MVSCENILHSKVISWLNKKGIYASLRIHNQFYLRILQLTKSSLQSILLPESQKLIRNDNNICKHKIAAHFEHKDQLKVEIVEIKRNETEQMNRSIRRPNINKIISGC